MTHEMPLARHVAIYKEVRERIAAEFGLDEDDEAVLDTTEGETDLADFLAKLMREGRVAAAQAKGIAEHQRQLSERKARLEAKHDRIKAIVLNAMTDAGLPKLVAPDFTATRTVVKPSVHVPDHEAVPDEFCRFKREPDKTAIGNALKGGASLPFAHFNNASETLTIRGS